ncbi:MAG: cysteine desulfurase family protein [Methylophilus sp.]|jgi:cysteine desulfurase
MQPVYFDHNSTTALKPEVLAQMMPWMSQQHGNPTSRHVFGRNARDAIEYARGQVAKSVGVQTSQVVFTASGTEANNFAITGIAGNLEPSQVLTSRIEHPCVSRPALALRSRGWQTNHIAVNANCQIDIVDLKRLLANPTGLVSIMLANNETGALQDIAQLSALVKQHKAYLHTDAVQALGKVAVDFMELGVNAMTISSHKIGGPLGAGALILDKRVDIQPLLYGGGQEKGLRSGTENIAAIVGFGAACELATHNLAEKAKQYQALRRQLETGLSKLNAVIFAQQAQRLPNTSFFAFPNIEGETLVTALDKQGFAVASGSACSSDSGEPSHVLLAMGIEADLARGAIRVSFVSENSSAQVDQFLHVLQQEVKRLKDMTAVAA